jgi:very-short-patch-repair endonuclease
VWTCQVQGVPDKTHPQGSKTQAPPSLPLNAQLAETAARQHGVVTAKQLGMSSTSITKRLRSGSLHRVHRGVYAVGHTRLSEKGEWMAAVLAAGEHAVLCGLSAAVLWQAWRRKVREIHVLVPHDRRPHPGFHLHTTRHIHPSDVTEHDGIPVTTMARTLVDLTDTLTTHQLANVIHEAAFRNRFNRTATLAAMTRANGRRNLAKLAKAIQSNSPGTRSDLEDRFLELIPGLQPNVNPTIEGLEVDFELNGLVVEIDGPGHNRPRTRRDDAARDAILKAAGYSVLRLTPDDLT